MKPQRAIVKKIVKFVSFNYKTVLKSSRADQKVMKNVFAQILGSGSDQKLFNITS